MVNVVSHLKTRNVVESPLVPQTLVQRKDNVVRIRVHLVAVFHIDCVSTCSGGEERPHNIQFLFLHFLKGDLNKVGEVLDVHELIPLSTGEGVVLKGSTGTSIFPHRYFNFSPMVKNSPR